MFKVGLVVGKFCPLHKGHELVINTALEQCEKVLIISYTSSDLGLPEDVRRKWLEYLFPQAMVYVGDHRYVPKDDADPTLHRSYCQHIAEAYALQPDAVFTSEEYGDPFALYLTNAFNKPVKHVLVDLERSKFPISGTQLRANPNLWADYTSDIVRIQNVGS